MKFRLSTFLLLITIFALATGWLWERRHYKKKLEEQVYTLQDAECSIIGSLHKMMFAQRLQMLADGEITQTEFDDFKTRSLMDNVIYLHLNEKIATNTTFDLSDGVKFSTDQNGRMLRIAGQSLHLLGITSSDELNEILKKDTDRIEWFGSDLFHENGNINDSFADFAKRSIENYQSLLDLSE